jgi:hypothetical protein
MDEKKSDEVDSGCVSPENVGVSPKVIDLIGIPDGFSCDVENGILHTPDPVTIGEIDLIVDGDGNIVKPDKAAFPLYDYEIAANPCMPLSEVAKKLEADPSFDMDKTLIDALKKCVEGDLKKKTDAMISAGCKRVWRIFRFGMEPVIIPADGVYDGHACRAKSGWIRVAMLGSHVGGHKWSGWPGSYCQRCGVEHVLESAMANGWYAPPEQGDAGQWKSDDHRLLMDLCDGFCYADMTLEQKQAHRAKIKALCDKLGL